ncbi:MAG: hypothetical protein NTX53_07620 [candidate division WOR-3 bacterium]|nr:hypothetical protein [candidate division WOR-3 bacterium]
MKVIISHDVDHLSAREHTRDLIVPKFVVRYGIEWFLGYTGWREVKLAVQSLRTGSWQHIDELMDFDEAHGVPSTFFVAVANGRKLCYPLADAREWIARIKARGFDVGVHGIEYESAEEARRELALFREATGQDIAGVRMHNIGYSRSSVLLTRSEVMMLRDVGYSYSTTTFAETGPWPHGAFWEFPIHLMDGHIFQVGRPWKTRTLNQAKEETTRRLTTAADRGVSHFSLLFHDGHFCDYHRDYRDWYVWVVDYLKGMGYPLCGYRDALRELNNNFTSAGPASRCSESACSA